MAHPVEPMDIDTSVCGFDNKENNFHHNNVLPITPCTEKGYEELDVSELNMKLRYSITPVASPMSKSYTASCRDVTNHENSTFDIDNGNMTRSLHSTLTKNDTLIKSQKSLPLQSLPTEHGQVIDSTRNALRPLDATVTADSVTVTVSGPNEIDENLSYPSSSSSMAHTPEATTPTKDITKGEDGGSPIIRGLKSVLNMFRPSQSPIPPEDDPSKPEILSPPIVISPNISENSQTAVLASTPLTGHKTRDPLVKKISSNGDSLIFNDDLEKELQWKDETTILFSQEKIPIHKLFFQNSKPIGCKTKEEQSAEDINKDTNLNETVEYMDISYNDSGLADKSISKIQSETTNKPDVVGVESDSEFVDCESTFTKNESQLEKSFISQDMDLLSAKKTASDISVGTIGPQSLNVTIETLKSADLSTASVDTKKSDSINKEEPVKQRLVTQDENTNEAVKIIQQTVPKEEISLVPGNVNTIVTNDSLTVINNDVIIDPNNTQVNEINASSKPDCYVEVNDTKIVNRPVNYSFPPENVGVQSISQIPLIADPRVLLFNISPSVTDTFTANETTDVLVTSPADIPLPDEDDVDKMVSLPVENTGDDLKTSTLMSATLNENIKLEDEQLINDKENLKSIPDENTNEVQVENSTLCGKQVAEILSNIVEPENEKLKSLPSEPEHILSAPEIEVMPKNMDTVAADSILNVDQPSVLVVENALQDEGKQAIEPTDVSMSNLQDMTQTEIINKEVANGNAFIPDVDIISIDALTKHETSKVEENKEPPNSSESVAQNSMLVEHDSQVAMPVDLITNIKQEVEAIVATAIDIVADNANKDSATNEIQVTFEETPITTEKNDCHDVLDTTEVLTDTINSLISDLETSNNTAVQEMPDSSNTKLNFAIDTADDQKENLGCNLDYSSTKMVNENEIKICNEESNEASVKDYQKYGDETPKNDIPDFVDNGQTTEISENIIAAESLNLLPPEISQAKNLETETLEDQKPKEIEEQKVIIEGDNVMEPELAPKTHENKIEMLDEEITVSENNSPFVSVSAENINPEEKQTDCFEEISDPITTKTEVSSSPPLSPKIVSKGYNINFDEIEDPFATKTKIRMSPALDETSNQTFEQIDFEKEFPKKEFNKNDRRKSQPQRKRPANNNKKMNSTFAGKSNINSRSKTAENETLPLLKKDKMAITNNENNSSETSDVKNEDSDVVKHEIERNAEIEPTVNDIENSTLKVNDTKNLTPEVNEIDNPTAQSIEAVPEVANEIHETSSSEQSTYLSAGSSSNERIVPKNSFNLPEINDSNFNPFATKSKIRQTPPRDDIEFNPFATSSKMRSSPPPNTGDPFTTKSKICSSVESSLPVDQNKEQPTANISVDTEHPKNVTTDKIEEKQMSDLEKDSSTNVSGDTSSSKTDKVNTEDEDTIEGPFLEAEDFNNDDKMSVSDGDTDMMQFSELAAGNEENVDAGEMFIDAEAFEFLLNQNKTDNVSDSGKESLFLKFDPLFAKRVSIGVGAYNQAQKKQSTPKKTKAPLIRDVTFEKTALLRDSTFDKSPLVMDSTFNKSPLVRDSTFDKPSKPGPSVLNVTQEIDSCNMTVTQSTSKKNVAPLLRDATFDKSPDSGPSPLNVTQDMNVNNTTDESLEDLNVTVSKPMMVVNPAVNPVVTPRNKSLTPVRTNRHSLTFTSPAIAVIDRLLSMSSNNNSFVGHDTTIAEVRRDNEADLALTQLRELLADKEISVYNLRTETKELRERLSTMETQMKNLETISDERLKKITELNDTLTEKTKLNKSMAKVVEEYERTIASLIAETEQDKKRHAEERMQLIKERDEQAAHLASMEVSFSDLHSKYEKSKQLILGFKANEDLYKKSIKEFEESLSKMQNNYELLKQHATAKLNHANEELQKINRSHESEVLKLNAMIKRKELHTTSLEETLLQKTKANEELTAICDELINKVG